ncbi:AI-2E family transporter [Euzebyella marina]|uniref:AI-2E family transporter n=1 Tax=Euzebyella marina TaxID=1761453 RepID=A0A3G2L5Q1_9FLAO|nr:AI-2E family transporter [Euzebyella marina]AYN67558.1 AI-2E family transporter [Euzebyella marina]
MPILESSYLKQLFLLSLIILGGILIGWHLVPFISGCLAAFVFYILLEEKMEPLIEIGLRPKLAAGVLTILTTMSIIIPPIFLFGMLWTRMDKAVKGMVQISSALDKLVFLIQKYVDEDFEWHLGQDMITNFFESSLEVIMANLLVALVGMLLMVLTLYYLLLTKSDASDLLEKYLPFSEADIKRVMIPARKKIRSNFWAIPITALAQSIVAFIGLMFIGVGDVFFWSVIIGFASIVPFIGSSLGFVPLFLLLLGSGKEILAWTTLLYGLLVISTIDNLIRILFLKSYDNIHPLQTLIGVIIGIPLLGIVGVIIGPILINTLFIMWEIYRKSYWVTSWDRENQTSP